MIDFTLKELLREFQANPSLVTADNSTIQRAANFLSQISSITKELAIAALCENSFLPSVGHNNGVLGFYSNGVFYPLTSEEITVKTNEDKDKKIYYSLNYVLEGAEGEEDEAIDIPAFIRKSAKQREISAAIKISVAEDGKTIKYPPLEVVSKAFFPKQFQSVEKETEVKVKDIIELPNSDIYDLGEFTIVGEKGAAKIGDTLKAVENTVLVGTKNIILTGGEMIETYIFNVGDIVKIEEFHSTISKDGKKYNRTVRIDGVKYWADMNLAKLLMAANKLPLYVKAKSVTEVISKEGRPYKKIMFIVVPEPEEAEEV